MSEPNLITIQLIIVKTSHINPKTSTSWGRKKSERILVGLVVESFQFEPECWTDLVIPGEIEKLKTPSTITMDL